MTDRMSRTLAALSITAMFVGTAPVAAEEGESPDTTVANQSTADPQSGIGVEFEVAGPSGLEQTDEFGTGTGGSLVSPGIRIPLGLGGGWRLEPNVGFSYLQTGNSQVEVSPAGTGDSDETLTIRTRSWTLDGSLAGHRVWSGPGATNFYVGLRFGAGYGKSMTDARGDSGETAGADLDASGQSVRLYGGPTFGGEYFLSTAISVGVEAGLALEHVRGWDSTDGDRELVSRRLGFSPSGSLVFRLYP